MRCNGCGIVIDGKIDLFTSCVNKHCTGSASGQFTLIGDEAAAWEAQGDGYSRLALGAVAKLLIDKQRTQVTGVAKISFKDKSGQIVNVKTHMNNRDLVRALARIRDGKSLPPDTNGRQHFHDGGFYENNESRLPVTGLKKYYLEFGIDMTYGPNGTRYLTGERIVVGWFRELYYTCMHYEVGSWWVFNPTNGAWTQFER
jgi:hypothetical protein